MEKSLYRETLKCLWDMILTLVFVLISYVIFANLHLEEYSSRAIKNSNNYKDLQVIYEDTDKQYTNEPSLFEEGAIQIVNPNNSLVNAKVNIIVENIALEDLENIDIVAGSKILNLGANAQAIDGRYIIDIGHFELENFAKERLDISFYAIDKDKLRNFNYRFNVSEYFI